MLRRHVLTQTPTFEIWHSGAHTQRASLGIRAEMEMGVDTLFDRGRRSILVTYVWMGGACLSQRAELRAIRAAGTVVCVWH